MCPSLAGMNRINKCERELNKQTGLKSLFTIFSGGRRRGVYVMSLDPTKNFKKNM